MDDYFAEQEYIEEIVLGMARIVRENRRLKAELEEAKEYKKKYEDLLDANVREAGERSAALFEAIVNGAFASH